MASKTKKAAIKRLYTEAAKAASKNGHALRKWWTVGMYAHYNMCVKCGVHATVEPSYKRKPVYGVAVSTPCALAKKRKAKARAAKA